MSDFSLRSIGNRNVVGKSRKHQIQFLLCEFMHYVSDALGYQFNLGGLSGVADHPHGSGHIVLGRHRSDVELIDKGLAAPKVGRRHDGPAAGECEQADDGKARRDADFSRKRNIHALEQLSDRVLVRAVLAVTDKGTCVSQSS